MGPAQRTNRLGLAPSRPSEERPGAKRQADHDHGAADPEPPHVARHNAAGDIAEPLAGEDGAGQQDEHSDDAGANPHSVALLIRVTYPTPP